MNQNQRIAKEDQLDIDELVGKIERFKNGEIDEERFKLYRLTRGVYGQRQLGVHMFRTKLPLGRITADQLRVLAQISDTYATGNLHLTTRQNIQFHYVKLKDSPKVWEMLAAGGLTAREACGNTVRNITASACAGIDPDEAFDVTPYVQKVFEYFLRNPVCQDMGRKIKPAFSSSDKDSAFTYFHDFGFVPKLKDGKRGFSLVVGGGLGTLPIAAIPVEDFIEVNQVVPFIEATLRVFDRYGERKNRNKARMKFLVQKLGANQFLSLIDQERKALPYPSYPIKVEEEKVIFKKTVRNKRIESVPCELSHQYALWIKTNVFEQKQRNKYGVYIKVQLGDVDSNIARELASIVDQYAADDIRITVNQGFLLRFVEAKDLLALFMTLHTVGLAQPGFDSIGDITACPGTDTCNLGVTNSTGLAKELEYMIEKKYYNLIEDSHLKIKISGCMNACGQHMASPIGLHGSSIKKEGKVIPAMQIVLGGGLDSHGKGYMAQRIIKLPTKRIPKTIEFLIDDFSQNGLEFEHYNLYVIRQGKRYFYDLLKPMADISQLQEEELFDWGQEHLYLQEIGVGECAGVVLDLVGTILNDAKERLDSAQSEMMKFDWSSALYYAYSAQVIGAKALLLNEDIQCNTHMKILTDFQSHFIDGGLFDKKGSIVDDVLRIKKEKPSEVFAKDYLGQAISFVQEVIVWKNQLSKDTDKLVVDAYFKA